MRQTYHTLKIVLLTVLYLMAAWRTTYLFIMEPGLPRQARTILSTTLQGKAHKPFVYRLLVPEIVKGLTAIIPDSVKQTLLYYAHGYKWNDKYLQKLGWEIDYLFENLLTTAVLFLLFFGFFWVARALIGAFYPYPDFVVDLAPLANVLLLPMFFVITNYTYDPGVLFFSALGLLLIQKRAHLLFLAVFIVACLNKETAVLLSFVFLVKEHGLMSQWRLTAWMVGLVSIAIAIKLTTYLLFVANEGGFVVMHLQHNWEALTFQRWYPPYLQFAVLIWGFLVGFQWSQKPEFLRQAFLVTFIPELLLGCLFGWLDEIRIFLDAYPALFLLSLPTFMTLFRIPHSVSNR